MKLRSLRADGVRILTDVNIELNEVCVFFGVNGSGKTSLLEAVSLLGTGRSFRSGRIEPVIQRGRDSCTVFGVVSAADTTGAGVPIGVTRHRDGPLEARVHGQRIHSGATLAEQLPLLTISSDTFRLVEGGPGARRRFVDWGVFHVEPRFHDAWLAFQRALKQRNSLLRRGKIDTFELASWNERLAESGERLDRYRQQWFAGFEPLFQRTLESLRAPFPVTLGYSRGWDAHTSLLDALKRAGEADLRRGYSGPGPQRADLKIRIEGQTAADVLSRGQQKLVVTALKITQGRLLRERTRRTAVYLVDDLPAELDAPNRAALCAALADMGAQLLITCVQREDLSACWEGSGGITPSMFHVEHGRLSALT